MRNWEMLRERSSDENFLSFEEEKMLKYGEKCFKDGLFVARMEMLILIIVVIIFFLLGVKNTDASFIVLCVLCSLMEIGNFFIKERILKKNLEKDERDD